MNRPMLNLFAMAAAFIGRMRPMFGRSNAPARANHHRHAPRRRKSPRNDSTHTRRLMTAASRRRNRCR